MSRLTVEIVETFWLKLNKPQRCAALREVGVVPPNSALNFTQQRLGLLKVSEERKLTKFRAALQAALPAKRRGPISFELKLSAVAACASAGLLRHAPGDLWHQADADSPSFDHDVVIAAINAGWLKTFAFSDGEQSFGFAVVTKKGFIALGKPS